MAYLPCHRPAFRICATTSGPNIPNRSPITSQNPPSTNFNPHSKEPFSTTRINTPRHSAYTAHVYTTNPLKVSFKTCPSLNHFLMNHPPLLHRWSNHSIDSMAKLILGQSALADNFQLDISWPKERKTFRAVDPSSHSWNLHSYRCSTSLLGSSFNSSRLPVPTILPPGMCTHCCLSCAKRPKRLSILTSFWSTRIWQVSSPALTKRNLSDHGSCSWTSFDQR